MHRRGGKSGRTIHDNCAAQPKYSATQVLKALASNYHWDCPAWAAIWRLGVYDDC